MSIWCCPHHGLTGPNPCCGSASLAQGIAQASQQAVQSVSADERIAQLTRERDEALKAVDENWVTHQQVIAANNGRDALAADLALHREALDWALRYSTPRYVLDQAPPHIVAILDASRKRVRGHE